MVHRTHNRTCCTPVFGLNYAIDVTGSMRLTASYHLEFVVPWIPDVSAGAFNAWYRGQTLFQFASIVCKPSSL